MNETILAERREDDAPEIANKRMAAFHQLSLPMAEFYEQKGKLISIEKTRGAAALFKIIRPQIEELMDKQDEDERKHPREARTQQPQEDSHQQNTQEQDNEEKSTEQKAQSHVQSAKKPQEEDVEDDEEEAVKPSNKHSPKGSKQQSAVARLAGLTSVLSARKPQQSGAGQPHVTVLSLMGPVRCQRTLRAGSRSECIFSPVLRVVSSVCACSPA
jgi:outer membrane biosynthesis protein TonB